MSTESSTPPLKLEDIPGLGIIRVRSLRKAGYADLKSLQGATVKSLMAVPGINEVKAGQILEFLSVHKASRKAASRKAAPVLTEEAAVAADGPPPAEPEIDAPRPGEPETPTFVSKSERKAAARKAAPEPTVEEEVAADGPPPTEPEIDALPPGEPETPTFVSKAERKAAARKAASELQVDEPIAIQVLPPIEPETPLAGAIRQVGERIEALLVRDEPPIGTPDLAKQLAKWRPIAETFHDVGTAPVKAALKLTARLLDLAAALDKELKRGSLGAKAERKLAEELQECRKLLKKQTG